MFNTQDKNLKLFVETFLERETVSQVHGLIAQTKLRVRETGGNVGEGGATSSVPYN